MVVVGVRLVVGGWVVEKGGWMVKGCWLVVEGGWVEVTQTSRNRQSNNLQCM